MITWLVVSIELSPGRFSLQLHVNDQNDDFSHESEILSERQHRPAMNLDASADFTQYELFPVESKYQIHTLLINRIALCKVAIPLKPLRSPSLSCSNLHIES